MTEEDIVLEKVAKNKSVYSFIISINVETLISIWILNIELEQNNIYA